MNVALSTAIELAPACLAVVKPLAGDSLGSVATNIAKHFS